MRGRSGGRGKSRARGREWSERQELGEGVAVE